MSYNRIAGQSVGRLSALSDGVFSIAMTLLVLDLRAPAVETIHGDADLWNALLALLPRVLMYIVTFMTLGIFWIGQQTQLNHLEQTDRSLSWIHIAFLFWVSITPFSTNLLAQFTAYRVALFVYWLNIFGLGATLYCSWNCAIHARLVKEDMPPSVSTHILRRIVIAQSLYAFAALLCLVNTRLSLAVFIGVQLYYVLGLRIPGRG